MVSCYGSLVTMVLLMEDSMFRFSFDIATDAGADELVTAIEANCTLRRLE